MRPSDRAAAAARLVSRTATMTESTGDQRTCPRPAGQQRTASPPERGPPRSSRAGILFSRVVGLVRERVFGCYFGVTDAADVFPAAFRIPNLLQNLFGEGVLSASFIPVYASLLARRRTGGGTARRGRRVRDSRARRLAARAGRRRRHSAARRSDRRRFPGREARADDARWCAYCFRAPGCLCCRRGASAS